MPHSGRYVFYGATQQSISRDARFLAITRSLTADKINFDTSENDRGVVLTFSREIPQRRTLTRVRPYKPQPVSLPPPLTVAQVQKRLDEAQTRRRNGLRYRLKKTPTVSVPSFEWEDDDAFPFPRLTPGQEWRNRKAHLKRLGAWLAKDLAGRSSGKRYKSDYAALAKITGPLTRSKYPMKTRRTFEEHLKMIGKRGFSRFARGKYDEPLHSPHNVEESNRAYAEVEFYTELLRLATERENAKQAQCA